MSSNLLHCICWVSQDSSVLRAFTETIDFSEGCQWLFSIRSARLAAQNLKDRPKFPACLTHRVGGQFCPGGILPSPCNGLFALGRTFLLYRDSADRVRRVNSRVFRRAYVACLGFDQVQVSGMGYATARRTTFASLAGTGWVQVSALPRSFTVTTAHSCNFLIIPKFVGFCKLLPGVLNLEGLFFQRPQ